MNPTLLRPFLFVAASLAMFSLVGCGTMQPLSSKPPLAKIVLRAPFSTSQWHGVLPPVKYSVSLPAGEYHALYEDDQYYYYQAPSKVVINDLGSSLLDGGIYVPRGTTTPTGWYYIDGQDGSQAMEPFNTPFPGR